MIWELSFPLKQRRLVGIATSQRGFIAVSYTHIPAHET